MLRANEESQRYIRTMRPSHDTQQRQEPGTTTSMVQKPALGASAALEAPPAPEEHAPEEQAPEVPRAESPLVAPGPEPLLERSPGSPLAPIPPQADVPRQDGTADQIEADAAAVADAAAKAQRRIRERRRSDAGMSRQEAQREARRKALNSTGFVAEDEVSLRLTGGTRSMLREECRSFWREKRLETLVACHAKFNELSGGGTRLRLRQLKQVRCPNQCILRMT